jgi:hypothetical protein
MRYSLPNLEAVPHPLQQAYFREKSSGILWDAVDAYAYLLG